MVKIEKEREGLGRSGFRFASSSDVIHLFSASLVLSHTLGPHYPFQKCILPLQSFHVFRSFDSSLQVILYNSKLTQFRHRCTVTPSVGKRPTVSELTHLPRRDDTSEKTVSQSVVPFLFFLDVVPIVNSDVSDGRDFILLLLCMYPLTHNIAPKSN